MNTAAPMGIIAAAGELPRLAAEAVTADGSQVFIVALKDISTADFSAFPSTTLRIGGIKAIVDALKEAGCHEAMLAGKLARPKLADVMPDALASGVVLTLMMSGDDAALRKIRDIFTEAGISIADTGRFFTSLRASSGLLAGSAPETAVMAQIERGKKVLTALGGFDIGQAVLIQGERVLAIEAAEGTDAMIRRCHEVIDPGLGPVVMVKMLKPGQDRALDPPVIGGDTVSACADAGVGVIAIEADGVIIADRQETIRRADAGGITLIGISA